MLLYIPTSGESDDLATAAYLLMVVVAALWVMFGDVD
jgi:hypothetical protein